MACGRITRVHVVTGLRFSAMVDSHCPLSTASMPARYASEA